MKRLSILGCFVLCLAAATPVRAQQANSLPQGEGRDLLANACSQCHNLNLIMAMREGQAGWRSHVYNMVMRGAQLTAPEAETVIRYLAANFGPGAPPAIANAAPVVLPGGTGKELVEARCTGCHDLERVSIVKRKKKDWPGIVANMIGRGAPATDQEAQAIAAYLSANFGVD